ncbi:hypothetical protein ACFQU7_40655 [Pseudoroseomonas wenyumeiae]
MNSNDSLMKASHNQTGVIDDIYGHDLSIHLEHLRCLADECDDPQAIAKTQEYLRAKFMPLLRSFINGGAPEEQNKNVILSLSNYAFRMSKASFCNSLPLLSKICALISARSSWLNVGKDTLILRSKVREAKVMLNLYEESGANRDFYYFIAKAIISSCDGDLELAQSQFEEGAQIFLISGLDPAKHLISDFRGAFNILRSKEVLDLCGESAEELPINVVKTAASSVGYLNFSAVDVVYFKRFVKHSCGSFFEKCTNGSYHVHLVAQSPEEVEDAFNSLGELRDHPNLGLSFSDDLGGKGNNAYYTMIRYFS